MHNDRESSSATEPSVIPIPALVSSIILISFSLLITPHSSGVPATFGNIFQPLAWFLTAVCVALGILICVPLIVVSYRRTRQSLSPGAPNKAATAISLIVLSVSLLQVIFALFGPDI